MIIILHSQIMYKIVKRNTKKKLKNVLIIITNCTLLEVSGI